MKRENWNVKSYGILQQQLQEIARFGFRFSRKIFGNNYSEKIGEKLSA